MISIFGSGADEHSKKLPMCLKAFTAQAQRRDYQGRALPTELIARHAVLPIPSRSRRGLQYRSREGTYPYSSSFPEEGWGWDYSQLIPT